MFRFAVLGLALLFSTPILAADQAGMDKKSKEIIQTMMGRMQETMQSAMKEGGPVNAIGVCNQTAPKAAASMSQESGYKVSRTSLKLRNPKNAPDAWELAVLQKFEERKAKGEAVDQISHSEIVTNADGSKTYRFMKAIGTKAQCLVCHGAPQGEVAAKLKELYPQDQATGFNEGDIRGAFTLQKKL